MVAINRRWQAEKFLQDDVDRGGLGQIFAPNDMCYTLACIIQHASEVIAGGKLLPRQHNIAQLPGFSFDPSPIGFKA